MRTGRASANSSIMLPERSAARGGRPGHRWLMRTTDLFRDLAPVGGRGRSRGRCRDDAGRCDADGRAAGNVIVVVRRELDVATDPDGAAVVGQARVVDARNIDAIAGEIDRTGQVHGVERADGEDLRG